MYRFKRRHVFRKRWVLRLGVRLSMFDLFDFSVQRAGSCGTTCWSVNPLIEQQKPYQNQRGSWLSCRNWCSTSRTWEASGNGILNTWCNYWCPRFCLGFPPTHVTECLWALRGWNLVFYGRATLWSHSCLSAIPCYANFAFFFKSIGRGKS